MSTPVELDLEHGVITLAVDGDSRVMMDEPDELHILTAGGTLTLRGRLPALVRLADDLGEAVRPFRDARRVGGDSVVRMLHFHPPGID